MAMTPEAKVKKKVAEQLRALKAYYFYPVTGGYGKSGVPILWGATTVSSSVLSVRREVTNLLRYRRGTSKRLPQVKVWRL